MKNVIDARRHNNRRLSEQAAKGMVLVIAANMLVWGGKAATVMGSAGRTRPATLMQLSSGCTTPSFDAVASFAVGNKPSAVATGDFNRMVSRTLWWRTAMT
jgi:hypothetical protein